MNPYVPLKKGIQLGYHDPNPSAGKVTGLFLRTALDATLTAGAVIMAIAATSKKKKIMWGAAGAQAALRTTQDALRLSREVKFLANASRSPY